MLDFIKDSGLFGWLVILILLINCLQFLRVHLRMGKAKTEDGLRLRYSTNSIIFWGAVSALMGFLGQYSGIYMSLNVISMAEKISPSMLAEGLALSFTTTLMGLFTLLLSAIGWFILHSRLRRLSRIS